MFKVAFSLFAVVFTASCFASHSIAVELKAEDVINAEGDGPDGKGNTEDDTWQFWFELAHRRGSFRPLTLATATMSKQQKSKGIPRKVTGPVASMLPAKETIEGWILHADWDGRFEGAWGDPKSGDVYVYPMSRRDFTVPSRSATEFQRPASTTSRRH